MSSVSSERNAATPWIGQLTVNSIRFIDTPEGGSGQRATGSSAHFLGCLELLPAEGAEQHGLIEPSRPPLRLDVPDGQVENPVLLDPEERVGNFGQGIRQPLAARTKSVIHEGSQIRNVPSMAISRQRRPSGRRERSKR